MASGSSRVAQAWITPIADDPESVSALAVARQRLAAGRSVRRMRRVRLLELEGWLPARARLEDLLHRSTQFYNPHKECCAVRLSAREPAPFEPDERLVLVIERGGTRSHAAERWWRHETGKPIEVRTAVAWALAFDPGSPAEELAAELAVLRGPRHGLLCNPHAQEMQLASAGAPIPWIGAGAVAGDAAEGRP